MEILVLLTMWITDIESQLIEFVKSASADIFFFFNHKDVEHLMEF